MLASQLYPWGKVEGESLAYDGVTGSSWCLQDTH